MSQIFNGSTSHFSPQALLDRGITKNRDSGLSARANVPRELLNLNTLITRGRCPVRSFTFAALVVAWFLTTAHAVDAGPKKPSRGISPAMAAGVAGGRYGVEVPVAEDELGWPSSLRHPHADSGSECERYASIASLMWPKLENSDLVVAMTHFSAGMASNPILAEGGVCWAVRRNPHEPDRLAVTWAILEPKTFQLLLVAPASAISQKVYVTSHDGWKFFNLSGETGPDGQFMLQPDGSHIRLVRAGTSEHARVLERIRGVLQTSFEATKRIAEKMDVDQDREPGIHGFLRVLFDLVRLVSSFSIIQGNLDKTGKSWGHEWGRYSRAGAEVTYRFEDFAWRTKVPSAEGTRGDKSASRWDVVGISQLASKVEKTYGELEGKGASADSAWCLDYVLGAPAPSSSPEPVEGQPSRAQDKEDVETGTAEINGRRFYTIPQVYDLGEALEQLRPDIGNWSLEEVRGLNNDLPHQSGTYLIPAWRNELAPSPRAITPTLPATQLDGTHAPPTQQSSATVGDQIQEQVTEEAHRAAMDIHREVVGSKGE